MNPLLAFTLEDVRMFSFTERTVLLTLGRKCERIEFASREQMQEAIREWLEMSVRKSQSDRT